MKTRHFILILLALCRAAVNSAHGDTCLISLTYDLVGNRKERLVTAPDGSRKTEYTYYSDGSDRLESEVHTTPSAALPYGNERIYAGNENGRIIYKTADGRQIHPAKAFVMGLPNELSLYAFFAMLLLVPVTFFAPAVAAYIKRFKRPPPEDAKLHLSLWRRCLCVLLAYTMLITPLGLQQTAQAATQYNQISTADWSSGNRTIEYTYDANGSCIQKVTKETSTSTTLETFTYEYNLQNRMEKATKEYDNSGDTVNEVTEYTYNDDSIRAKSYYYETVNGGAKQNEETKLFLIDAYNHTGYAQVLEETADDGSAVTTKTYTIGDDVLTESIYDGSTTTTQHLLYDGHGSTRQTTNSSAAVTDVFSFDGYGVLLGSPASTTTNLLYTGEQFDNNLNQYYLRARYYNQSNGLFNRVDPYAGNLQDPQSLHKYLYAHNNPVNNVD